MDSSIIAAIVAAIVIITAAVIGFFKFRAKSEEQEKSDGNELSPIDSERPKANKNLNKDRDIPAFNRLQKLIDSNWIQNFESNQLAYPQYVQVVVTDDLHSYWNESRKPENEFRNQNLAEAHLVFAKAIKSFINAVLRETAFMRPESKASVINSKAEGYRKSSNDYNERYDREVKIITNKAKGVIYAYKKYVQVARNEKVYR